MENNKEKGHTRRVGSITCGLMLVLYGILFLIHIIHPKMNYMIIFELWPLILIFLGVEILAGCTKANQEKKKFVYDFAAVLLIFIVAIFAMVMSGISYYYDVVYNGDGGIGQFELVSGSKDFVAKDVTSITLNNEWWDVSVMPSDDNDIHVSYSGTALKNEELLQFKQTQNDIVIDVKSTNTNGINTFFWNSHYDMRGEVTLYLPASDVILVRVNNDSGDMQLCDISCGRLEVDNSFGRVEFEYIVCAGDFIYDNDSGNTQFKNFSCKGFTLNSGYGNIKLEELACTGDFIYDNDSGSIQFENLSCEGLTLNNNYGSINLDNITCSGFACVNDSGDMRLTNSSCGDFYLDNNYGNLKVSDSSIESGSIETDSGNLSFNEVSAKSMKIDSSFGNVDIKNADSKCDTAISSESGNVSIKYEDKSEDLSFEVKSDYGSIKIGMENVKYDYNMDTTKKGTIGNGTYHTSITTETGAIILE